MRVRGTGLLRSEAGAVAPTVALSLFGLIAAGGLAFDYARLASLDTELQQAADHAALAAASQLDGETGACARAAQAASAMVANETRFANDGQGITIDVANEATCDAAGTIRFYQDKPKTTPATSDADARFVEVTVEARRADYAFTPVAGAFNSGNLVGTAYAGLGSAVCKVPPLMMCNPVPGTAYNPDNHRGQGLKLIKGGNDPAAGNFGWLDVGAANNGTPDQNIAVGLNSASVSCIAESEADVDTGVAAAVMDALNVRFDIFNNGWARNTCYDSNNCNPSDNSTKDVVRRANPSKNACGVANNNNEWKLPPVSDQYIPTNSAGDDGSVVHMGYPMDICHYPVGGCGPFGDGSWRRDIYFKTNHPTLSDATGSNWQAVTGLPANATRYDFYDWEKNTPGMLPNVSRNLTGINGGAFTQHGAPVCKTGISPSATQPDRRVLTIAVVDNCEVPAGGLPRLSGSSIQASIGTWAEVFLVQPSISRSDAGTSANEIYVEIIGTGKPSGDGENGQLVRRSVPYLIE